MKIRKWLGLELSEKEVIKLRLADQTLVPLTYLLEGSTQEKYAIFIMEGIYLHTVTIHILLRLIYTCHFSCSSWNNHPKEKV